MEAIGQIVGESDVLVNREVDEEIKIGHATIQDTFGDGETIGSIGQEETEMIESGAMFQVERAGGSHFDLTPSEQDQDHVMPNISSNWNHLNPTSPTKGGRSLKTKPKDMLLRNLNASWLYPMNKIRTI